MKNDNPLYRHYKNWRFRKRFNDLLLAAAWALPLSSLAGWFFDLTMSACLGIFLFLSTILFFFIFRKKNSGKTFAYYLNAHYPSLENSSELLLETKENHFGLAELQREIVQSRLNELDIHYPIPHYRTFLSLFAGTLLAIVFLNLPELSKEKNNAPSIRPKDVVANEPSLQASFPELTSATVKIIPPAYTRQAAHYMEDLNIRVPEASLITWEMNFTQQPQRAHIEWGSGKILELKMSKEGKARGSFKVNKNDFYTIQIDGKTHSAYYQLAMIPDKKPDIEVLDIPSYQELPYDSNVQKELSIVITDDYGIRDARLIATISKGEGEAVKFRDDTLRFETNFRQQDKKYKLQKRLALNELGMEVGDELYFHIEAVDNREPKGQSNRTIKYIIAFQDTTQEHSQMSGGMPIVKLPAYFRSQRQIIIDTEKLLEEKSKLNNNQFVARSNAIAADQKGLRLRYGQFLGEEFETNIGEVPEEEEHDHEEGKEHEEEAGHHHDHDEEKFPEENRNVDELPEELEPYLHQHDIAEELTYYDEVTSAKLRAALAQMWEAELRLRLAEPGKALPYEYRALKLIKEIQQASRIYVERVGFNPPAIKVAEKRLTGDLDDIQPISQQKNTADEFPFPAIRKVMPLLEELSREERVPVEKEKVQLEVAGDELAAYLLEQPGSHLSSLQTIKDLIEEEIVTPHRMEALQKSLGSLLPEENKPIRRDERKSDLKSKFLKKLSTK